MRKHSREYDNYMKSDAWAAKREERLRIDGNKCALCGRPNGLQKDGITPILQVHHIRYSSLGQEPMEDLLSLCPRDHRLVHKYLACIWNRQDKQAAGG